MSDRDHLYPLDRRAWLLAIGRRLRVEYDAIAEPVPPRLAALVKQLEMPAHGSGQETSKSAMAPADLTVDSLKASALFDLLAPPLHMAGLGVVLP
jgi:hypothetical protein